MVEYNHPVIMQQSKSNYSKDRYPGLRAFEKDQNSIFFGRETESNELFNLVSLEKTVVFFGKSGLGKSSLLNAGLGPLLEANGYLPVRVRFSPGNRQSEEDKNNNVNVLLRDFIVAFNGFDRADQILFDKAHPQLWEYVKCARFCDKKDKPLIPVFIFDQFEEFFYHPVAHQQEFARQLSEITHTQPPRRIIDWVTAIPVADRKANPEVLSWYHQPEVKFIFALRSDKLALMQSLTPHINTILRNRYELKALSPEQAAEAIAAPASKVMPEGYTPAFTFNPGILAEIVKELQQGSNDIESSQLQMVCNYIEQKVRVEQDAEPGVQAIEVDEQIIVPARDIAAIRNNFYEDQLCKIPDAEERALARRVLEDEMVIEGQRASLLEKQLIQELEGRKDLMVMLQQLRLIREEPTNRGVTYEVSHDTLVEPIERSRQQRAEMEKNEQDRLEREREKAEAAQQKKEQEENIAKLLEERKRRAEAEQQKQEADRLREEAVQQKQEAERLREEAEEQRQEANRLREEAIEQRKKISKLYLLLTIVILLGIIGGLYFYDRDRIAKQKEAIMMRERAEKDRDSFRIKVQQLREKDLNNADRLLQEAMQMNRVTTVPNDDYDPNQTKMIEEKVAEVYEIIKDTIIADTTDLKYKQIVNDVYNETRKMQRDPSDPEQKSLKEKKEYIDKKLLPVIRKKQFE
jgi:hypothetical protein